MPRVERILSAFRRDGEELVAQWPLLGIELKELQSMFDVPPDNPMYDEYEVQSHHIARLEQATGQRFDLSRFEYLVGAVAVDDS